MPEPVISDPATATSPYRLFSPGSDGRDPGSVPYPSPSIDATGRYFTQEIVAVSDPAAVPKLGESFFVLRSMTFPKGTADGELIGEMLYQLFTKDPLK